MSKNFNSRDRDSRRGDKFCQNYNKRSEDKRPSVFERLGARKESRSPPRLPRSRPSSPGRKSYQHRSTTRHKEPISDHRRRSHSGSSKSRLAPNRDRNDDRVVTVTSGRRTRSRSRASRKRSRSKSKSPYSRTVRSAIVTSRSHEDRRTVRGKSSVEKTDKSKSRKADSQGKSKERSASRKVSKDNKKVRGRSASNSASSSKDSSSTSVESSTSVTSSTSNLTTTSDSSVPSVKLREKSKIDSSRKEVAMDKRYPDKGMRKEPYSAYDDDGHRNKRKYPDQGFPGPDKEAKRNRVSSPPPPPHMMRRAPLLQSPPRNRNAPPPGENFRIIPPHAQSRRSPFDESSRTEGDRRLPNKNEVVLLRKGFNRDRDRYGSNPNRPPPPNRGGREPPAGPSYDRDRNAGRERARYEPNIRRLPPPAYKNRPYDDNYQRNSPAPYVDNQASSSIGPGPSGPLLAKSKEALYEKYEEDKDKQSRVSRIHSWVDETAKRPKDKELAADAYPPLKKSASSSVSVNPSDSPEKFVGNKSIAAASATNPVEDIAEMTGSLSDFSDDDDDILTKEIPEVVVESERKEEQTEEEFKSAVDDKSIGEGGPPIPTEGRSTRSQMSHTEEDDILETMDFEEISDEELDDKGNKVHIVDALGVDWSSLVCKEKSRPDSPSSVSIGSVSSSYKVRERWNPLQILKQIGVHRDLCGEERFQRVLTKLKESCKGDESINEEELENPMKRRRRLERENLIESVGLGPNSRALSSRRELAMRRYWMNLPPKPLLSLDLTPPPAVASLQPSS